MTIPLVPRKLLFGNVAATGANISPDANWISWNSPVDGVLNIWLAPKDDLKAARPLTRTKARPIYSHTWSDDSAYILYLNDQNGDENNHAYAVNISTGEVRDLTPFAAVSAFIELITPDRPHEIGVMVNDRDPSWFDAYAINVATGERRLLWLNDQGYEAIGLDWNLVPRWGSKTVAGGDLIAEALDAGSEQWLHVPQAEVASTHIGLFNRANTHLHLSTPAGNETRALFKVNWKNKRQDLLARSPLADIDHYDLDCSSMEIMAAHADPLHVERIFTSEAYVASYAAMEKSLGGFTPQIVSQSGDNQHWIVMAHKPTQAATWFHFDRQNNKVTEICRARPYHDGYKLAPMQAIKGRSRDGLRLPSYLSLPPDVKSDRPERPLPMVLLVHGGPWGRDIYGYSRQHQWLANRSYAVLSVNYRGSTGFGKSFVEASTHEHGRKMFEDLLDMVAWAVTEGIADKSRIAIYGASYGGYSAFLGATLAPDVFCCAVPVVGISNLQTLLENMPPYWAGFAEFMYSSYGDPRTEEGRALLAERSPITEVDRVSKPMLIFHGQNDVRCKVSESEAFVAAMRERSIPGLFVVFPDEGHGVDLPGNAIAEATITEAFFARHLGGRLEPMGDDLKDSSYEVRFGEEIFTSLTA